MRRFLKRSVFIRVAVALTLILAYAVYMYYFDDYNRLIRNEHKAEIKELQQQIVEYKKEYRQSDSLIKALKTSKQAVEKYAREHYKMKKEGEQLFLIEDKK